MTILLMFHIFSAIALVAISVAMVGAAIARRDIKNIKPASSVGLVVTLLSGAGLLLLGASFGHFCVSMTLMTAAMFAARSFYISRVPSVA